MPDKRLGKPLLLETGEGRAGTPPSLADRNVEHPPFREAANQGDVPMKLSQLAAAAVVFLAGSATEPAFAATDPDVIWRGDFDDGTGSLGGHCDAGTNGWCHPQTIRPRHIQLVTDLALRGHGP